ncbi:ArsR/SmtB family transcription factor [Streptomyces clavifer]|uniref:ArsR/SmtB family transcription factor n=1 Tax=Streptomyces clavifer TaxID=68188 RepID=UPI003092A62A|nr:metalloregulator ArsR/SmtB family transcription factor [Streptomyces clavifer]
MPDHSSSPALSTITLPSVLGALSDPTRLGIVRVLSDGNERGWGELRAPIAKSTLSHHLKVLREAGVTQTRQEGTRCFVTLHRESLDARFPGLLPALLAAAVADHVGEHVTERDAAK